MPCRAVIADDCGICATVLRGASPLHRRRRSYDRGFRLRAMAPDVKMQDRADFVKNCVAEKSNAPCPTFGDAMEIPGSGYIYAVATITFAGVAATIMVL